VTPFTRPANRSSRATRGFTLIELLVVMTLLSVLMTGLISAMRTMAQTESRIDQRLARLDELRTTHAFLSQTLGALSVARVDVPGMPGKTTIPFVATANSVTWVGILPGRPGAGGRHYFRLAVEPFDTGDALALWLVPCDADMTPPNWATAERHLLTTGVAQLAIYAQGSPPRGHEKESTWPNGWQTGWPIGDALPEQLRLSLQDATQTAPQEWTFALHALPQGDDSISIVSFGGGRR
jgi:general secretion pathway protein J